MTLTGNKCSGTILGSHACRFDKLENSAITFWRRPTFRKNKDFVFLPVPILPGWLKILHLSNFYERDDVLSLSKHHPSHKKMLYQVKRAKKSQKGRLVNKRGTSQNLYVIINQTFWQFRVNQQWCTIVKFSETEMFLTL